MRIRKCASKLLGMARACPSSPAPSPSSPTAADACSPQFWAPSSPPPPPPLEITWKSAPSPPPAAAAEVVCCQLNCSPWDVMADDLHRLQKEEDGDEGSRAVNEEEENDHDRGIAGSGVDLVKDEAMSLPLTAVHSESSPVKERRKSSKQKHTRRKTKQVTEPVVVITCKKSDGKGWRCKRPAQHPHTLCHYHLNQLRSYSCNGAAATTTTDVAGNGGCRRKKADAINGADGNMYYYYYSGFGPWRGKTRGSSSYKSTGGGIVADSEEEEEARENLESSNRHDDDAPVAGDDEESLEEQSGIFHDEYSDSVDYGHDVVIKDEEEKQMRHRKRGRKSVKARSLKSLL